MLDFPASPTTGQIYNGTNGVTYMWTGTIWVATGASAGGDFFATIGTMAIGGEVPIVFPTVVTGNSGGWYSTSTGRYLPPAGRFWIFGWAWGNSPSSGAGNLNASIFKNGVQVPNTYTGGYQAGATSQETATINVMLDANGSDYFDIRAAAPAGSTLLGGGFGAYPISGIKGPPGDVGTLSANIGTRIGANFGAGGIPGGSTWAGAGWSVVSNDTGVADSAGTWMPPAGRWIVNANMQAAGPDGTNIGLGLSLNGGTSVSGVQQVNASPGGPSGYVGLNLNQVIDFDGSTVIGWMVFASGASCIVTAESWWSATRIR